MGTTIHTGTGLPVLRRHRLTRALSVAFARKLAVISAPGGYGKTTLVRDFIAANPSAAFCWMALDPADASLPVFIQQLARTVAKHLPPGGLFGFATDRTPADLAAVRHLGRMIAGELDQHAEERMVLVLDDFHHVADCEEILHLVEALVQNLPDTVHLMLACRGRPRLPLGRLQARHEVVHLTADDLAFTDEEVRLLFRECLGLDLPEEMLKPLQAETEGWAAALVLMGTLLKSRAPSEWQRLIGRFPSGGALFDFLAEEVFGQQPPHIQDFLLGTCHLATLQPAIIERLRGSTDAGAILQGLEAQGLFTLREPTDLGHYRYHHLFQVFLQQLALTRWGEAGVRKAHADAARVHESVGNLAEAVEHYLAAAEYQRALPLIAEQVDGQLKALRHETLRGWLQRIPSELHDEDPDALYLRAQMAGWLAQNEILPALYQRCLELYDQRGDHRGMARCLSWVTNRFWKLRHPYFFEAPNRWAAHPDHEVATYGRMLQAFARTGRGQWSEAFAQLQEQLSTIAPATRAYFDCLESLAMLAFWTGDYRCAIKYGVMHTSGRTAMGDFRWGIYNWISYSVLGDALGLEAYQRQFAAVEVPPSMSRMHEMVNVLGQGFVHLFHGRREEALACFESLRPHFNDRRSLFRTMGSEATFIAQQEMAQLYARQGRREEARLCLQRNLELTAGYPEITTMAYAAMAGFLAQEGDVAGAKSHLAVAAAANPPGLDGAPRVYLEIASCKVALAEGDQTAAQQALTRALDLVRAQKCQWLLLHAGGPELLPALVEMARSPLPDGQAGQLIFQLIGSLGQQAGSMLSPLLGHQDPAVKSAARTVLEQVQHGGAPERAPCLKVYSFGVLRLFRYDQAVESPDWKRNKVKMLLLLLLMRRGRPISKDGLTQMLWPDAPPTTARTNLRATIHGLKRSLEPDLASGADSRYILSDRDNLWMDKTEEFWFDLWEFDDLIQKGKSAQRSGRHDEAARALQAASDLYRDAFLSEIFFADHFQDVRARTEQSFISACLDVAIAHYKAGDLRLAVEYARRVLAFDRTVEEAYQVLIQAYLARGERERAMQTYKTCRKHLKAMLGSEPSPGTRQLLEA